MAAALRKLIRSSTTKLDHKCDQQAEHHHLPVARRLFGRACNSMHRDATKVSPAENLNATVCHGLKKASSKNNSAPVGGGVGGGSGVGGGTSGGGGSGGFFRSGKKGGGATAATTSETSTTHAKLVRTRRLMREFQEMSKHQEECSSPVFTVELVEDNLFEWNVKLFKVDSESDLYRDMQLTNTRYILLNLTFPDNFPFSPPFMRVISPRIEKGFVMEGGAICMELLTPGGWASAYTIEAIIMQFSASLVKGQGRIAKKSKSGKDFSRKSAEASFRSLVKTHEKYGWVTPPLADG